MQPYQGSVSNVTLVGMQTGLPLQRTPWESQAGIVGPSKSRAANESLPFL